FDLVGDSERHEVRDDLAFDRVPPCYAVVGARVFGAVLEAIVLVPDRSASERHVEAEPEPEIADLRRCADHWGGDDVEQRRLAVVRTPSISGLGVVAGR